MGACCAPGDRCRQAPAREVKTDSGDVVLVNLLYYPRAWCIGPHPGIAARDQWNCPDALLAAVNLPCALNDDGGGSKDNGESVSRMQASEKMRAIWTDFMGATGKLSQLQRKHLPMGLFAAGVVTLCFLVITMGAGLPWMFKQRRKLVMAWDAGMQSFEEKFNARLHPLGILVKTQSNCTVTYSKDGRKRRHIERWFAFALTPESIATLKSEPRVMGDIEDNECCGRVAESECCMHPP